MPNGRYVIRVTGTDAPSNPEALALTGDKESAPFEVDNTPPTVLVSLAAGLAGARPGDGARRQQPGAAGRVLHRRGPLAGGPPAGRDQRRARGELRDPAPRARPVRARTSSWCAPPTFWAICPRAASKSPSCGGADKGPARPGGGAGRPAAAAPDDRRAAAGRAHGRAPRAVGPGRGAGRIGARRRGGSASVGVRRALPASSSTAASRTRAPPQQLRRYDAALVYTRNASLARNLGRLVPMVVQHDPEPPAGGPHAAEWLASCLPAIGVPAGDGRACRSCAPSEDDQRRAAMIAADLPPGFLALHPGSGSPAKNWPAARFADLRAIARRRALAARPRAGRRRRRGRSSRPCPERASRGTFRCACWPRSSPAPAPTWATTPASPTSRRRAARRRSRCSERPTRASGRPSGRASKSSAARTMDGIAVDEVASPSPCARTT